MIKKIKIPRVLANASVYLGSSLLNRAVPFLILPVLTRLLGKDAFGSYTVLLALSKVIVPLIILGLDVNIARNFFRKKKDSFALMNGLLIEILTINVFVFIMAGLLYFRFEQHLFGVGWFWSLSLIFFAASNAIVQFTLICLRCEERPLLFGLFEIGNTSINLGLGLLLIMVFNMSWEALAISMLIANVFFAIFGLFYLQKRGLLRLGFDSTIIKEVLGLSIPFLPYAVGTAFLFTGERFFIQSMLGETAVAEYAAGAMFGMVVLIFAEAFNKAWSPWFYSQTATPTMGKKKKIIAYTYMYIAIVVFLATTVTLSSGWLIRTILPHSYSGSERFVPWIAFAGVARAINFIIFPYFVHMGKTKYLSYLTGIAAVVSLLNNYLFIKISGSLGAAQAQFVSNTILLIVTFYWVHRIYQMPWFSPCFKETSEERTLPSSPTGVQD